MLIIKCTLCEKSSNYSTEELCGRYFMCKHCRWLNLLHANPAGHEEMPCPTLPVGVLTRETNAQAATLLATENMK